MNARPIFMPILTTCATRSLKPGGRLATVADVIEVTASLTVSRRAILRAGREGLPPLKTSVSAEIENTHLHKWWLVSGQQVPPITNPAEVPMRFWASSTELLLSRPAKHFESSCPCLSQFTIIYIARRYPLRLLLLLPYQ